MFRTLIAGNDGGHEGGGIRNDGNALVEHSTIAHNVSSDGGGIENTGSLVVKNSAIIFNSTGCCQPGGGILNFGGSVQIVNSTIANNFAGLGGGGGHSEFQRSSFHYQQHDSAEPRYFAGGGGIANFGGTVQIQNTIVAGNILSAAASQRAARTVLGPSLALGIILLVTSPIAT